MYLCGLDKVSKVLSACVFKITIVSFSKVTILLSSIIFNTFTSGFITAKIPVLSVDFRKAAPLLFSSGLKDGYRAQVSSWKHQLKSWAICFPFCMIRLVKIVVRLGALRTSFGFIWNIWRQKHFLKTRSLLVVTEGGWHNHSLSDRMAKHSLHMISGFRWEWFAR